jgi:hypothetical protein
VDLPIKGSGTFVTLRRHRMIRSESVNEDGTNLPCCGERSEPYVRSWPKFKAKTRCLIALLAVGTLIGCGIDGGSSKIVRGQIVAQFSSSGLSFGNQPLNSTSSPQTLTVTDIGGIALTISSVTLGGANASDFTKTADTCNGMTIGSNGTCTVTVKFTPTATGIFSATLTFVDNDTSSPQIVMLTGTGGAPAAGLSAPSLSFGNQPLNIMSSNMTEIVTNTGTGNLSISTVALGGANAGDFSKQTDNCTGATLTSSSTCAINVAFTPSATGSRSASLAITDNASNSPQSVALSGTGTSPAVTLSVPSLSFGNEGLSVTSAGLTETVTNAGTGNLVISTATLGGTNVGDFAKSADTCTGATVAASGTCAVTVTFTPLATGSLTASLTFTDNASGSPQTVVVSGTGTPPTLSFSSPGVAFGNQALGVTSAAQTETITNTGTSNLVISTVTLAGTNAGDFAKSADTCTGATVASTATCAVSLTFTPTATGSRAASLSFADNVAGSPQTVNVSGTGAAPAVGLSSPSLGFGNQALNVQSANMTETITNNGTANLIFTTVTLTGTNFGDFAKGTDTCTGATVTPTSTCAVNVTFTPSATGPRSAMLNFADNAAGSPQAVGLSGNGATALVGLGPTSGLSFGGQLLNSPSTAQVATLTNNGTVNLSVTKVAISGTNASEFAVSADNCTGQNIAPNLTCTVNVTFTPAAMGVRSASISFTDDATGSPQAASLTGTGIWQLAGVFTNRYDNQRTGQNTQETFLTVSNVTLGQFGKLFALPVDGQVYTQPLYVQNVTIPNQGVHNVVYVATEHDTVFAFDADGQSTVPLWQTSFLNAAAGVTSVPSADVYTSGGSPDMTPEIGITSTPVIDPVAGILYVTAKTREPLGSTTCTSNGSYDYCYRLHALNITTGAEMLGGPTVINGSVAGDSWLDSVNGVVTFGALHSLQRPGLLLLNGTLYLGFGSHGDIDPYHGWVMAYDATSLQQTAIFCDTPSGTEGAIWQSGGGLSADSNGYIYVVTANGTFDIDTGGNDYGDSVLKMQIQSGQFQVVDYFTPANQDTLRDDDLDLGAGPALIMPDQPGTYPHLLAMGGKDGRVWLINRDNLGQYQTNDAGAIQVIPGLSDALFGGLSYWNYNLYLHEAGDYVHQYPLVNGLAQTPNASSAQYGGFPNVLPAISSNGTANGVMWFVEANAYGSGGPAVLYASDANNIAHPIYTSAQATNGIDQAGPAVKFALPTVANGKVYVGASGEVDVYGLLP